MTYQTVKTFGSGLPVNGPLTNLFNSSGDVNFINGFDSYNTNRSSKVYRDYMSDRCSSNWDSLCPIIMNDKSQAFPFYKNDYAAINYHNLTAGEMILKSTAEKKYLSAVNSTCQVTTQKYNPLVGGSPLVSSISTCDQIYAVDPQTIDDDPVMMCLINKPMIAPELLLNIYRTMKANGTFESLKGTQLYLFYQSPIFKNMLSSRQ